MNLIVPDMRGRRLFLVTELILLLALTGCTGVSISGLEPRSPGGVVDSLQPILQWERFPTERDLQRSSSDFVQGISHVRYEVLIWRADEELPLRRVNRDGTLVPLPTPVYVRMELPEPRHMIQVPLQPHSAYCWTVRAIFLLHGQPRVTQWSEASYADRGLTEVSYHVFYTPAE